MNALTLRNKIYAHKYAYNHKAMEWCNSIIEELEAENYHTLIKMLLNCEWQAAYKWIDENMQ